MSEHDIVDRAAATLRQAKPNEVDPRDEALLRAAQLAGAARHRNERSARLAVAAMVGGALAAVAALALWHPWSPTPWSPTSDDTIGDRGGGAASDPPGPRARAGSTTALTEVSPTVLRSERGDRMVATDDARFEVGRSAPSHRVIRLSRGAVLFEIGPLEGGHFEVRTPDIRVTVTGTVFVVEVEGPSSFVEVFEGRVLVRDGHGERTLGPGDRYGRPGRASALLREEGLAAARRRTAAARRETTDARGEAVRGPVPSRARAERVDPEAARALIVEGRADEVLALARAHTGQPRWRYVEGDALRALSRVDEAVESYDAAIAGLPRAEQWEAAYVAAGLHLRSRHDPARAIASLDAGRVDDPDCPLRERALVLRAEALQRLGDRDQLREVALEYVRLYPAGNRAAWMGRIVDVETSGAR